jgi:hypothetical protein
MTEGPHLAILMLTGVHQNGCCQSPNGDMYMHGHKMKILKDSNADPNSGL